jgi:hypothetical protein
MVEQMPVDTERDFDGFVTEPLLDKDRGGASTDQVRSVAVTQVV